MERSSTGNRAAARSIVAALIFCSWAPLAHATDISFVSVFRNLGYTQTGNGNSLAPAGNFFSADLFSVTLDAYSSVSMSYPGPGSPASLAEVSPPSTLYHFQTGSFATQADMDTAFPTGTYTFTTNTPDTASFDYSTDDYAQSLPYLTGTDFSALQGMNPASPFTFHFSPFVTGSTATFSFVFFTIFDVTTNTSVFDAGFNPASTTSVTVPGHTLNFGDTFIYELDFSNRDLAPSPGAVFDASLGFDRRTDGTFTAASVPEPSTSALFGLAFVALVVVGGRRRRAHWS